MGKNWEAKGWLNTLKLMNLDWDCKLKLIYIWRIRN